MYWKSFVETSLIAMPTSLRSEKEILSGWGEYSTPLVSICCITYNHSEFVKDAFDGFLMQKTKFSFEIIVFDDASTDETQRIILDYIKEYPKLFVPFLQKENLWQNKGISGTFTIAFPNARGKYIAWCEGDDYWTDPLKLQKQVDFLESDPNIVIVGHRVKYLNNKNQNSQEYISAEEKEVGNVIDILKRNYLPTASVILRRSAMPDLSWLIEIIQDLKQGDWPLFVFTAQNGKILFLNEVLAVYRVHGTSVWSSLSAKDRLIYIFQARRKIMKHFTYLSIFESSEIWSNDYLSCVNELKFDGKIWLALYVLLRSIIAAPWNIKTILKTQQVIPISLNYYIFRLKCLVPRKLKDSIGYLIENYQQNIK